MQHTFCVEKCKTFVEKEFMQSALPSLVDFIKIDNMSKGFYSEQEWKNIGWGKNQQAANHVFNWIINAGVKGLKAQIISNIQQNLTPLIFVEIQGQVDQTYLFYGHFDKQPPFVGWNQGYGAYIPVLYPSKENPQKLYGRGGADDGYSAYGSVLAIKALQDQGIPIPRCILMFQGDEETTSGDVEKHVSNLVKRIGNPKLVFCLDSGALDYERFWITTSLRGFSVANIKVEVLKEGVHSGDSSGIIPNSFRILRSLLSRIEDQNSGYMNQALDVDIPPNRYKEMYELAHQKGWQAVKPFDTVGQLQRVKEKVLQSLILNGWKAQLSVVGSNGLPQTATAGNVMLPYTQLKLSIRLPPTINPHEAEKFIVKSLGQNAPYNAKVTLSNIFSGHGFNCPDFPQVLQSAMEQASQSYFGKSKLATSEGFSIPFMGFLNETWPKAHFIITGVLGPASNAHGPNEFLHIPYVKRLICSMAHILAKTVGKM